MSETRCPGCLCLGFLATRLSQQSLGNTLERIESYLPFRHWNRHGRKARSDNWARRFSHFGKAPRVFAVGEPLPPRREKQTSYFGAIVRIGLSLVCGSRRFIFRDLYNIAAVVQFDGFLPGIQDFIEHAWQNLAGRRCRD